MASQEVFYQVYRGRLNFWRHAAYMRMAKVLLAQQVMAAADLSLENKRFFDYGFGAGTFFQYCPKTTQLYGVEIDAQHVQAVREMLARREYRQVHLETIDLTCWEKHPLLSEEYDVILCSHVLEHLEQPVAFLNRLKRCLTPGGAFVGLLPINERRANPQHVQTVDRTLVQHWMDQAGLEIQYYTEADPWIYWVQPLFTTEDSLRFNLRHKLSQIVSLGIGVPATLLGYRTWQKLSPWFARLTFSKPTQAGFVVRCKQQS